MAWNAPASLSKCAARTAMSALVRETEWRLRSYLALVPAEHLIARATAGLLLGLEEEDDDEDEDEEEEEEENQEGVDAMEHALRLTKEHLQEVSKWWRALPGLRAAPGYILRAALDAQTEVNPKYDQEFPTHLSRMLLKVLLLESVFVDRDYGDKDRRCVVPFAWERWVARLVTRLGPFEDLQELKVYGGMYPSILAAILKGAPFVSSVFISHINITDEILVAVSRFCPRLERLYLLHNYPWQVISISAFCAAFFSGATRREMGEVVRMRDVRTTFASLKKVDLAYGEILVAKEFHKYLLSYYPEMASISSEWKTNVFEDGYSSHYSDVVIPLIAKGYRGKLRRIYLDALTIYTCEIVYLLQMKMCFPEVRALTLDCRMGGNPRVFETTAERLQELMEQWPHLNELHVNVSCEDHATHAILTPAMRAEGGRLTTLIIEATSPDQRLHSATVRQLVALCPLLVALRLRVWSRSMLEAPSHDANDSPPIAFECPNLEEFCLHEEGPGDQDEVQAEEGHLALWTNLLQEVVAAAPQLVTLSISICQGLAPLMDKIRNDILVLHLHVTDGHEWQPTVEQVSQMVSQLPRLQHLYLEEVSGRVYWRVRRRYQTTGLQVHWGNLYEWPRT